LSRPLVALASALFALAGLVPIALMLARIAPADLVQLVDARTLRLLGNTIGYGLGSTLLALVSGTLFAFLVARTDLPGASWLRPLGVLPLFVPPLFVAVSWNSLTAGKGPLFAVLMSAATTFPIVALFAGRAFERIDARLSEAALQVGGLRAAARIELGLALPAALCGACFAFSFAINDFTIPDFASWVGPKLNVYAAEVFATWSLRKSPGHAVATALPLIVLSFAVLLPALALRARAQNRALLGDQHRAAPLALGLWRWPSFAGAAGLIACAALVPLAHLAYQAGGGAQGFALARFGASFERALELARGDLVRSLCWASAAAAACCALALPLGHALERARRGRAFEPLLMLPVAVPAVLLGIGAIATWNHAATAFVYDGGLVVVLLYVGRFAAIAVLVLASGVRMLDPQLEEAARLAGAGPVRRLLGIVAPCLRNALCGCFALCFVLSMRELDATVLVPAANGTAMFRVFNALHFGRDDFVAALALLLVFLIALPAVLWSLFARRRLEFLP
jgi:iron(III) transport system permease protein